MYNIIKHSSLLPVENPCLCYWCRNTILSFSVLCETHNIFVFHQPAHMAFKILSTTVLKSLSEACWISQTDVSLSVLELLLRRMSDLYFSKMAWLANSEDPGLIWDFHCLQMHAFLSLTQIGFNPITTLRISVPSFNFPFLGKFFFKKRKKGLGVGHKLSCVQTITESQIKWSNSINYWVLFLLLLSNICCWYR